VASKQRRLVRTRHDPIAASDYAVFFGPGPGGDQKSVFSITTSGTYVVFELLEFVIDFTADAKMLRDG
jgi:hypothetical protein